MENQRIRLSKAMLKAALIELLSQKTIEKITIHELCQKAQINRTTFYKYYGSQYDLLEDIENDFFADLEKYLLADQESELDALQCVLEYLDSEREKCLILTNSVSDQIFATKLFGLSAVATLLGKHIDSSYSLADKKYISLFICHGAYAIIRKWLGDDNRESPAEIAALIHSISVLLLNEK